MFVGVLHIIACRALRDVPEKAMPRGTRSTESTRQNHRPYKIVNRLLWLLIILFAVAAVLFCIVYWRNGAQ